MFPTVLDIIDLIINQKILSFWIVIFIGLAGAFRAWPQIRNLRAGIRIVIGALLIGSIVSAGSLRWASVSQISLSLFLAVNYGFAATLAYNKPIWPASFWLKKTKKVLKAGYDLDLTFNVHPLYFLDAVEVNEWHLLKASYKVRQHKYRDAYEEYNFLAKNKLTPQEKASASYGQVICLWSLGDYRRAKLILNSIDMSVSDESVLKDLFVRSLKMEADASFENSVETLFEAVARLGETDTHDSTVIQIYNNLGRMRLMQQNYTDAERYYKKAKELAIKLSDKLLLHVSFQNLIGAYYKHEDNEKAEKELKSYREMVNENIVSDLLEYYNFQLQRAWLLRNENEAIEIVDMFPKLLEYRVSKEQELALDISILHIRWNLKVGWEDLLSKIESRLDDYLCLSFPEKYGALDVLFNVLENLFWTNPMDRFAALWGKVFTCFTSDRLLAELEAHRHTLPEYCIKDGCYWLKQKTKAIRLRIKLASNERDKIKDMISPGQQKPFKVERVRFGAEQALIMEKNVQSILKLINEIVDIQMVHDNKLEAIDTLLYGADEFMAYGQQLLWLQNVCKGEVWRFTDAAIVQLNSYKLHPAANQYNLRIARYALYLGRLDIATEYFATFLQSRERPQSQQYFNELASALGLKNSRGSHLEP